MKATGLLATFFMVCGLVFTAETFAAERQYGTETSRVLPLTERGVISESQLIGMEVLDRQNRPVGEIQSLLLDMDRGQIGYVVLSPHPETAATEAFIVPWNALSRTEGTLIMNVDRAMLDRAPAPRVTIDDEFGRQVHQFYGVAPYWQERVDPRAQPEPGEHLSPPPARPGEKDPWAPLPGTPPR
jgi:sporulation protein YlmC with PRC-barrel domain